MAMYGKRPMSAQMMMGGQPSHKQQRMDLEEGQWACGKCGNVNFAGRAICNMRSCGARKEEGPWVCPGCGNENRPGKLFCNMRKCGLAKPGLTAQELQAQQQASLDGPPPHIGGKGLGGKGGSALPAGSWKCVGCGNSNFPTRDRCNGKNCGRLREEVDGGEIETSDLGGGMPAMGKGVAGLVGGCGGGFGKGGGGNAPEGSWACLICKNVNFPNRTECNGKGCGQPRSSVDGGAPVPDVGGPAVAFRANMGAYNSVAPGNGAPAGSWSCPSCNNVNYPNRDSCNKRNCGQPRPSPSANW